MVYLCLFCQFLCPINEMHNPLTSRGIATITWSLRIRDLKQSIDDLHLRLIAQTPHWHAY